MGIKRGCVYWVDMGPARGSEIRKTRPCVVLGIDPINEARRTVVIVPLSTSGTAREPLVVGVRCGNKDALAVMDQIRAVDKSRIKEKMTELSVEDIQRIEDNMRIVLGL